VGRGAIDVVLLLAKPKHSRNAELVHQLAGV